MVTFREYMESALYAPGLGFYERRGPTEDFYTAPELHPAFAGALAGEAVRRLEALEARRVEGPYFIVEMGSGDGSLGRQILAELRERHAAWAGKVRYVFVERCEAGLLAAVKACGGPAGKVLGYSRIEDVPACAGVFLSNELVDAFPMHLLEKRGGEVLEVCVRASEPGGGPSRVELGPLSTPELAAAAEAVGPRLEEGARHAVNLEARRWLRAASKAMTAGTLLTVDYGKRFAGAPNPPRTYRRHTTDDRVTERAGRQDLTASVDFEALIDEGARCGLALESYTTLSRFLIDRGILERLAGPEEGLEGYKRNVRAKTLFHPEGMGEAFKVLIQEKRMTAATAVDRKGMVEPSRRTP